MKLTGGDVTAPAVRDVTVASGRACIDRQPPSRKRPMNQGNPPANWYPDPKGEAELRYWDGTQWTEHTHSAQAPAQPAPAAPPPSAAPAPQAPAPAASQGTAPGQQPGYQQPAYTPPAQTATPSGGGG